MDPQGTKQQLEGENKQIQTTQISKNRDIHNQIQQEGNPPQNKSSSSYHKLKEQEFKEVNGKQMALHSTSE